MSEINVPFGVVLMSNGMIETGTSPEPALASTVNEISPRPKVLPGLSVVDVPGVATVSNPKRSLVAGGGGGVTIRLPPKSESATLLPTKMYELAVVDVVAFVNKTPEAPGTRSSNWKPATLKDWVLVEGLSRSSSSVPEKPGGTARTMAYFTGTTSTTREPARAGLGWPMALSSKTAAAITPSEACRRGQSASLEKRRIRIRVLIPASMVVSCLRKKTQSRHLWRIMFRRGASGCLCDPVPRGHHGHSDQVLGSFVPIRVRTAR